MEDMFKDAFFGKAYKTRDGRKALYQRNFLSKYIEPSDGREYYISLHTVMTDQHVWQVDDEGKREDLRRMSNNLDIISEWEESINENELNKWALEYCNKQWGTNYQSIDDITDELDLQAINDFKAGCRETMRNRYGQDDRRKST